MKAPSTYKSLQLSALQAVTLANLACSVPSLVIAAVEGSLKPWLTFVALVQVHALLFGIPALWFICSRDSARGLLSVVAGTIIGALPIAILLADASGPGLRYGQSVTLAAVSGAAVGLVTWQLLTKFGKQCGND